MREQQNPAFTENQASYKQAGTRLSRGARYVALLAALGGVSLVAGFETARRAMAAPDLEMGTQILASARGVSAVRLPKVDKNADAELKRLPPQEQVERLLERALQDDEQSLDQLSDSVDSWRGHLKSTDKLFDLVLAAMNSADLRLRTVAIDVDLAANNLSKTPDSVVRLQRQIQRDAASRGLALWRLGALGNRGVEPEKVLNSLLTYARSRDEHTRYWAVEGLAMLGNDATLDPLLDRLAHDSSERVRELAASCIGQAGMLTREERLSAVPNLLNLADDDSLGTGTRELVYGTLRVITGAALGNDAEAWRAWWANHDPAKAREKDQSNVTRT
jgi:HEAT repeat protein